MPIIASGAIGNLPDEKIAAVLTPEQLNEYQRRTVVEDYNARLEKAIGPVAAEAYRKQGTGRIFSSFSTTTMPTSTTTTVDHKL